ncbi:MAG TPA: hypothetical protein VKU82_02230 [Planctomycetaceae bacterium]|nr:hypothetical protein [Planctomycetaceae bacterium]
MMKEPVSEEILSAFVDGELTPDERAEVERWLDHNPQARETVDAFRRISGLFETMARSEVPAEFPAEVLQRAERKMLLADAGSVSRKKRARGWLLALAAPIAAAAVLIFVVRPMVRGPGAPERAAEVARHRNGGELSPTAEHSESDEGTKFADSSRTAEWSSKSGQPPESIVAGALSKNADDEDDPRLATIIDDIRESSGEQNVVSVMRMYVADRAQGMVLLQDVLSDKLVIVDEPGEDESGVLESGRARAGTKEVAAAGAPHSAQNEALYVVAEPEQVIAAFREILARDNPGLRLAVEPPIEVAALDAASRKELNDVTRAVERHLARRLDETDSREEKAPAPAGDDKPADNAPQPAQRGEPERKPENKPAAPAAARKSAASTAPAESRAIAPQKAKGAADLAAGSETEGVKDAGPAQNANRGAALSRQRVVQVPSALENRQRGSEETQAQTNRNSSRNRGQAKEAQAAVSQRQADKSGDKLKADAAASNQGLSLVRVLILIEPENPPPASPNAEGNP